MIKNEKYIIFFVPQRSCYSLRNIGRQILIMDVTGQHTLKDKYMVTLPLMRCFCSVAFDICADNSVLSAFFSLSVNSKQVCITSLSQLNRYISKNTYRGFQCYFFVY